MRIPPPLVLLIVLDLTFNLYFWRIPKLTSPWSDFGYEFLRDAQLLGQTAPSHTRVIAFGSSIVGSFNPVQVQGLLRAANPSMQAEVYRLLVPGIKPSDSQLFFNTELDRLRPDVVVLTVNVADFLNPSSERDLKQQVRYVLPPWRTLLERHAYMSFGSSLDLVLATISNFYHYRQPIRSCLQDHVTLAARWVRRRPPRRTYGIYADRYTEQYFGLPLDGYPNAIFEYYIDPGWIQQYGQVTLSFSVGDGVLTRRVETEPGWKTVDLGPTKRRTGFLHVASDGVWSARAAGLSQDARPLGIRLRQPAASRLDGRQGPPLAYPPRFPQRTFLRMGDAVGAAYLAGWEQALHADTADGQRFRSYEQEEIEATSQAFAVTQEYAALAQLVASLCQHGVAVVLTNSPESPLLLRRYERTAYYQGHLAFLRGLTAQCPGVQFEDLAAALPVEDFNDWHHVNYIGAIRLGQHYADFVKQAMLDRSKRA